MSNSSLSLLERDVEQARSKLASDLDRLRSPATMSASKDDLRQEAVHTTDRLIAKAQESAKDWGQRKLDDLKERALANPAATLAIAAGVVWRLVHRPPVASMLVGLGLFSMFRSSPPTSSGSSFHGDGHLRQFEQAPGIVPQVAEMASVIRDKASELTEQAVVLAQDAADRVTDVARDAAEQASSAFRSVAGKAAAVTNHSVTAVGEQMYDPDVRDKYLLGFAAIAITAALGLAYQRSDDSGS